MQIYLPIADQPVNILLILAMGLAVVLGVLTLAPGTAAAHALVQSSDPADGALLQSAPRQVVVTFTQAPDPKLSSMHHSWRFSLHST